MPTVQYTAKVKENLLLELPKEVQALELQPGEEVTVSVERNGAEETPPTFPPNEKGLAIMREIAALQKDMPHTELRGEPLAESPTIPDGSPSRKG